MLVYCSNCGTELPDGVSFCDVCGTPVRGKNANSPAGSPPGADPGPGVNQAINQANGIGTTSCPVCGAATLPGEAFCDNCGAALLTPTSYTPVPPQQPAQQFGAPPSYSQSPMPSPGAATSYAPARTLTASFVIAQPPPPATIQIPDRPELIIGRSDPQSNSYPDVDLGPYGGLDLGVSRRHFRLTRNGDHFYLEDLNAMNGSIINGQPIPPYTLHPLRSGDRITLGKMEIAFDIS